MDSIIKALRSQILENEVTNDPGNEPAPVEFAEGKAPNAADLQSALVSLKSFISAQDSLFDLVMKLQALIPKIEKKRDRKYTREQFMSLFLDGRADNETFTNALSLQPSNIALVVMNEFFANAERFEVKDAATLPGHEKLTLPFEYPKATHTTIELAKQSFNVPVSREVWFYDKQLKHNFVVNYSPSNGGGLTVTVESSYASRFGAVDLGNEIKKSILTSRFLKGQIIEIDGGNGFQIVDIGDQMMPVISEYLLGELEKNVINLFDREDDFKKYNLPMKRAIILEGPPGNGKSSLARYLAVRVKGKVTTVWVTAKSIREPSDVAAVFDIARKLSPALVIMEDLDLISGTRDEYGSGQNCLGEMLNQLDGLTANDSIVLVGTTNAVANLDAALNDRPGRFDRIYEVGHPEPELAEQIARNYLLKHGINQEQVDKLTLASVLKGDFSGAQIVEIVKGGIFEAIHRNVPVSDMCIKASADGLEKQKAKLKAGQSK